MTRSPFPASLPDADSLAIAALGFLAADPDRTGRFLALTGVGPDELRGAAGQPAFLVAVLDHLLADEPLLLVFCGERRIDPRAVWEARRRLSGEQAEGF